MTTTRLPRRLPRHVVVVILVALVAISSASVLIKFADDRGVGALAIAFWRTFGVAVLVAPGVLLARRRGARDEAVASLTTRDRWLIALGGACLAGHFATWITSLHHTSVMRSTVLVTLAPIWVALMEWTLLKRPPAAAFWRGIAIALGGALLLAIGQPPQGEAGWLGDGLALLGGLFGAGYWLAGREARQTVDIGRYAFWVSVVATAIVVPAALVTSTTLLDPNWSWEIWAILAGLVVGAQLLGHNGFNYAMKYLPASMVSGLTLLEPVGATFLAGALLGEIPSGVECAAGVVIVTGVLLASAGSARADAEAAAEAEAANG